MKKLQKDLKMLTGTERLNASWRSDGSQPDPTATAHEREPAVLKAAELDFRPKPKTNRVSFDPSEFKGYVLSSVHRQLIQCLRNAMPASLTASSGITMKK